MRSNGLRFWVDLYSANRFNIEYQNGGGISLSQPEVARKGRTLFHIEVDRPLGTCSLKERLHLTVGTQGYGGSYAAFASAVFQRYAVNTICPKGRTESNAPTCELLRSADDIAQTDFYRFGTRRWLGWTRYIPPASIIPPWWFGRFRGPWPQGGCLNSERTPETEVRADHNRCTDADENSNYFCFRAAFTTTLDRSRTTNVPPSVGFRAKDGVIVENLSLRIRESRLRPAREDHSRDTPCTKASTRAMAEPP